MFSKPLVVRPSNLLGLIIHFENPKNEQYNGIIWDLRFWRCTQIMIQFNSRKNWAWIGHFMAFLSESLVGLTIVFECFRQIGHADDTARCQPGMVQSRRALATCTQWYTVVRHSCAVHPIDSYWFAVYIPSSTHRQCNRSRQETTCLSRLSRLSRARVCSAPSLSADGWEGSWLQIPLISFVAGNRRITKYGCNKPVAKTFESTQQL